MGRRPTRASASRCRSAPTSWSPAAPTGRPPGVLRRARRHDGDRARRTDFDGRRDGRRRRPRLRRRDAVRRRTRCSPRCTCHPTATPTTRSGTATRVAGDRARAPRRLRLRVVGTRGRCVSAPGGLAVSLVAMTSGIQSATPVGNRSPEPCPGALPSRPVRAGAHRDGHAVPRRRVRRPRRHRAGGRAPRRPRPRRRRRLRHDGGVADHQHRGGRPDPARGRSRPSATGSRSSPASAPTTPRTPSSSPSRPRSSAPTACCW